MNSGAVTLGEIAGIRMLELACSRCERHGLLSVAKLIQRYGADPQLPALREAIAGDCPRIGAASIYDRWKAALRSSAPETAET